MKSAVRSFFDLLPFRIEQKILGRALRGFKVRKARRAKGRSLLEHASEKRRIFIDVSVISKNDAGTGIQRVVRSLALGLLNEPPGIWHVSFVSASRRRAYHAVRWPEAGSVLIPGEIHLRPGDIFLGLDFSLDTVRRHRKQLARFRRNGGQLWFVMYDVLPARRPQWFSNNMVIRFNAWLQVIAGLGDGFLCISQQTENDLKALLRDSFGLTCGYKTHVIPMGHEISESTLGRADGRPGQLANKIQSSIPFFLMVGTLEPRKGHADVIAAFDVLWRAGSAQRLILVGRVGWRVDKLKKYIVEHPEFGRKLIWRDDIDDGQLVDIYRSCQGVIVASHAEGFGLPLIEALGYGKPVFARDLLVFRTHEEHGVRYFPADAGPELTAAMLAHWMSDIADGRIKVTQPTGSWKSSVSALLAAIDDR